jgi:hypothetical protein
VFFLPAVIAKKRGMLSPRVVPEVNARLDDIYMGDMVQRTWDFYKTSFFL